MSNPLIDAVAAPKGQGLGTIRAADCDEDTPPAVEEFVDFLIEQVAPTAARVLTNGTARTAGSALDAATRAAVEMAFYAGVYAERNGLGLT